jgi:hypothetical protein
LLFVPFALSFLSPFNPENSDSDNFLSFSDYAPIGAWFLYVLAGTNASKK